MSSKTKAKPAPKLFIPCTPKMLPADLAVAAAKTAIAHNPANRPAMEGMAPLGMMLSPEFMAVVTSKYWGAGGVTLTVGFMEKVAANLQNRILSHMNAWAEWANVKFSLSTVSPQVRITLQGDGYWSYLGTDIEHIPAGEPTMSLQEFTMNTPESEYRRVVRHESMHTLGAPHEHMRSEIVNRLDVQKTIAWGKSALGWSASMVQQQILTPLSESSLMGTPHADETSIMAYQLPSSITKDGKPIVGGSDIDLIDQAFIGKIYPKKTDPVTPPTPPPPAAGTRTIVVTSATKITIDGKVV